MSQLRKRFQINSFELSRLFEVCSVKVPVFIGQTCFLHKSCLPQQQMNKKEVYKKSEYNRNRTRGDYLFLKFNFLTRSRGSRLVSTFTRQLGHLSNPLLISINKEVAATVLKAPFPENLKIIHREPKKGGHVIQIRERTKFQCSPHSCKAIYAYASRPQQLKN